MATVTRRETVCNVGFTRCKNDDLEFYEIRKDSHRPVKLALCVKHRKAIEQLLETAKGYDPDRRGCRAHRRADRVPQAPRRPLRTTERPFPRCGGRGLFSIDTHITPGVMLWAKVKHRRKEVRDDRHARVHADPLLRGARHAQGRRLHHGDGVVPAGEESSDDPRCVHTVLSTAARSVNDALGDDARQRLLPLLMRFLDTNTTPYEALEPVLREAHAERAPAPRHPLPGGRGGRRGDRGVAEAGDVRGAAASLEVGFYEDAVGASSVATTGPAGTTTPSGS